MVASDRGARFALRFLFFHTSVLFLCLQNYYRATNASSTTARSGSGLLLTAVTSTIVHVSAAVAATTGEQVLFGENEMLGAEEGLGIGTTGWLEDDKMKREGVLLDNSKISALLFAQTAIGATAIADTTSAVVYDGKITRPSQGTASAPGGGGGGSPAPERQEEKEEGDGRRQRRPGWEKKQQRRLRRRHDHVRPSRKTGAVADNNGSNEILAVGGVQNSRGQQQQNNGGIYTQPWSSSTAAQQPNPTKQANNDNDGNEHPSEEAIDETHEDVEGATAVVAESGGEGAHEGTNVGNDAGAGTRMVKFRLGGDVDSFMTGETMRGYLNRLVRESVAATNNQVYLRWCGFPQVTRTYSNIACLSTLFPLHDSAE